MFFFQNNSQLKVFFFHLAAITLPKSHSYFLMANDHFDYTKNVY